jgi:hypothetical protein
MSCSRCEMLMVVVVKTSCSLDTLQPILTRQSSVLLWLVNQDEAIRFTVDYGSQLLPHCRYYIV